MRRALLLTVPLLALVPLLGSGQATAQAECGNGAYPYPPTTDAHVTFSGLPTTPGNEIGLGIERTGGGEINPDSMRYEVDGPAGHSSIPADRYMTAQYTPALAGTYSVAAHWTEYTCSDYSTSTTTTTPAATFTTIEAKPPTVLVRTSRRPKTHNSHGDATLEAFLNCSNRRNSDKTPTRLAVYYTLDGHSASHSSKHAVITTTDGCWAGTTAPRRDASGKNYRLGVSRALIAFEVTAPGRADVLMELSYGGKLLRAVRGRFRPVSSGESVKSS